MIMNIDANFCDMVKPEFSFLIQDWRFRISRESSSDPIKYVEYLSDLVYVRVICTGPDFEPKMAFGRIGRDGVGDKDSYSHIDLCEIAYRNSWDWRSNPSLPYNGLIAEFARLLKDFGQAYLRGESDVYAAMDRRREELRSQHLQEEQQIVRVTEAEKAWTEKRYRDYVGLLNDYSKPLSPVDLARMAYAQKRI